MPKNGKYNEIIFCAKSIHPSQIISCMTSIGKRNIDFKIAQPQTSFIIGSNSIDSKGDFYSMKLNSINRPGNLRSQISWTVYWVQFHRIKIPFGVYWITSNNKARLGLCNFKVNISFTNRGHTRNDLAWMNAFRTKYDFIVFAIFGHLPMK